MWNEKEKKSKVGIKGIGDNWEETGNMGAEILYRKGYLDAIKAGRSIDKIKTENGYTLQPPCFPLPVEVHIVQCTGPWQ